MFSRLYFASSYHQPEKENKMIEKTDFRLHFEQCDFVVVPFGFYNFPATFQRSVKQIITAELNHFFFVTLRMFYRYIAPSMGLGAPA